MRLVVESGVPRVARVQLQDAGQAQAPPTCTTSCQPAACRAAARGPRPSATSTAAPTSATLPCVHSRGATFDDRAQSISPENSTEQVGCLCVCLVWLDWH